MADQHGFPPLAGEPELGVERGNGERADAAVVAELRPGGRLGRLATALRSVPEVPVTIFPSPETLQVLFDLARQDSGAASTAGALRTTLDNLARCMVQERVGEAR